MISFTQFLAERTEHVIDRDDLIYLSQALEDYSHDGDVYACFINATCEAMRIVSDGKIKIIPSILEKMVGKRGAPHYDDVKRTLKQRYTPSSSGGSLKMIKVDLKLKPVHSADEIKSTLRKGMAVILVVVINDAYWDWFGEIAGWRNQEMIDKVREKYGAAMVDDFQKKLDAGIVPFPPAKMLDKMNSHTITHAIVVIGYDASEKAFICKDTIVEPSQVKLKGHFKLEEAFFFDEKLKAKNMSVVKFALALDAEITSEVATDNDEALEEIKLEAEGMLSETGRVIKRRLTNLTDQVGELWDEPEKKRFGKLLIEKVDLAELARHVSFVIFEGGSVGDWRTVISRMIGKIRDDIVAEKLEGDPYIDKYSLQHFYHGFCEAVPLTSTRKILGQLGEKATNKLRAWYEKKLIKRIKSSVHDLDAAARSLHR